MQTPSLASDGSPSPPSTLSTKAILQQERMKANLSRCAKEEISGSNHRDSPWGILRHYQKNKGEKKNENFTNRSSPATNKQQAQSSSSPACLHSDYVLLFVAVLRWGKEENRFMIVNFPPMCFASALMVFFGCLHRCYIFHQISLLFPRSLFCLHSLRVVRELIITV